MAKSLTQIKDELADREAIRDCLTRYARAIDRVDEEELDGVFWEDATDDHIIFSGGMTEFKAFFLPLLRQLDQSVHLVGNCLIEISGAQAHAETYFFSFIRVPQDVGGPKDSFAGGRYLDRMQRRGDEWRIAERTVVVDWFRDMPDSADWSKGYMGSPATPGGRKPTDVSYRLFHQKP